MNTCDQALTRSSCNIQLVILTEGGVKRAGVRTLAILQLYSSRPGANEIYKMDDGLKIPNSTTPPSELS